MENRERIVILGAGESGTGAAILARQKGFDVFVEDHGIVNFWIEEFSLWYKKAVVEKNNPCFTVRDTFGHACLDTFYVEECKIRIHHDRVGVFTEQDLGGGGRFTQYRGPPFRLPGIGAFHEIVAVVDPG